MEAWLRQRMADSRARDAAPAGGDGAGGTAVTFGGGDQGALTLGGEPWVTVDRGAAGAAGAPAAATPPTAAPAGA